MDVVDPNLGRVMVHEESGFIGRVTSSNRRAAQMLEDVELELTNGGDKRRFRRIRLRHATPQELARHPVL